VYNESSVPSGVCFLGQLTFVAKRSTFEENATAFAGLQAVPPELQCAPHIATTTLHIVL
jgi:hypothetical protein